MQVVTQQEAEGLLGRTSGLRTPNQLFSTLSAAAGEASVRLPSTKDTETKAASTVRDPIALLDADIKGTKISLNQRARLVSDLFAQSVRRASLPTATAQDIGFKDRLRSALASGRAMEVLKEARKLEII